MISFMQLINEPCLEAKNSVLDDNDLQTDHEIRPPTLVQDLEKFFKEKPKPRNLNEAEKLQVAEKIVTLKKCPPDNPGSTFVQYTKRYYYNSPIPQAAFDINEWNRELAEIHCKERRLNDEERVHGITTTVFEYRAIIYNKITTEINADFFALRNPQDTNPYPLDKFLNTGKTRYFSCPILDDPWFDRNQQSYDEKINKVTFELTATVKHKVYIDDGSVELMLKNSNITIKSNDTNISRTFKDFIGSASLTSLPQEANNIFTKWLKNNSYKEPKPLPSAQIPDDSKLVTCSDDCGRPIDILFLKKYKSETYIQTVSKPPNSVPSYTFYSDVYQQYESAKGPKTIRCERSL